ncbi:MAG: hypothetical protein ACOYO1_20200 [Bacteroidales bacterium]
MGEKKFGCKMEDVAIIAGFTLSSMETDKLDFFEYSNVFNDPFIADVKLLQKECRELFTSTDVLKQQKDISEKIMSEMKKLRIILNHVEGYLKLAAKDLSIGQKDFGLKSIRKAISKSDVEGVLNDTQSLIANLKLNKTVLEAKGMKPLLLTTLTDQMAGIEKFNQLQNDLKNKRSRIASDNIQILNELWSKISVILKAGLAMYRGVDKVKLKEYSISSLAKRVFKEEHATNNIPPLETV